MAQLPHTFRTPPAMTPPDLAARMRRYALPIITGTLVLAASVIGVQIYLLKSAPKPHEGEDRPEGPAWTSSLSPVGASKPLALPAEPKSRDGATKHDQPDVLLDVVGSLMSAHLYETFVSVGLLADAVEEGVYPVDKGKALLETLNSFIDHAERQLVRLPPSSFQTEEDRKAMELARSVLTLLRAQTKELKAYWDETGDDRAEHVKRFREARAEAGAMIQKLVNVQD
jgi:hypothetical protein